MASKKPYFVDGDFGGYTVREAKTGYSVTFWSRIQGHADGRKILVPYTLQRPRGMDLAAKWNEHTTNGQAVAEYAHDSEDVLVLAHGSEVR